MAWCDKCRSEYEPHVKKCAECGAELVDDLQPKHEVEEVIENGNYEGRGCVHLINVANSIEADSVISRLEAENIPAFKGYQSSGEYLNIATGFNYQGVDIYVPAELIEDAKLLLSDKQAEEYDPKCIDDQELEVLGKEFKEKRKRLITFMVIIIIAIPIILLLIDRLS